MRKCNHKLTGRYDAYCDGKGIMKYSVRCKDCGKHIGIWLYGAWLDEDEDEDEDDYDYYDYYDYCDDYDYYNDYGYYDVYDDEEEE